MNAERAVHAHEQCRIDAPVAERCLSDLVHHGRKLTVQTLRQLAAKLPFGTNANAGVCIHFREKVPSPLRRKGHSALTVTVEDVEGLTDALTR